jgi:tetratricopeptide (TPR) repeat protein
MRRQNMFQTMSSTQMSPDNIIALFNRLKAALNANDRRGVNAVAFALLDANAPIGDRWRTLCTLLHHNGEYRSACRAMANFVSSRANSPEARFEQAAILAQTGNLADAWEIMQSIPADVPEPAGHAFILGSIAVNLGTIKEAQSHLLAALDANPALGQAMLSLSVSEKMIAGNEIGDQIVAAQQSMQNAPPLEKAHFQFALGKVYFDRGEADAAFAAFDAGNILVAPTRPHDSIADEAAVAACQAGFDLDQIDRISAQVKHDTKRPIFVTGLPRSGTTLVEHILASHSKVIGGEELGRFPIIEREIGGPDGGSLARYLTRADAEDLTALYLHLISERFGDEGRVVDKSLNSSRHIGQITSLLPDAPIIWLRRSPLDCAWSAYRTYFLRGLDWSWNLEAIGQHFKYEDRLFAHWTGLLGDRILVVNYEALVSDPDTQIRRLLKHCDLDAEPAVFEPHKTKRTVTTASVVQVRQPINKLAIDAAAPYRKNLQPFIDAYEGGN